MAPKSGEAVEEVRLIVAAKPDYEVALSSITPDSGEVLEEIGAAIPGEGVAEGTKLVEVASAIPEEGVAEAVKLVEVAINLITGGGA